MLVFEQTGDHKIPAKKLRFQIAGNNGREINTGGSVFEFRALRQGFWEIFYYSSSGGLRVPTTKKKISYYPDT